MKEEILMKSFKEPLEWEGKMIRFLKELPKKVMESRKEFKSLTDKLRKMKIKYRRNVENDEST